MQEHAAAVHASARPYVAESDVACTVASLSNRDSRADLSRAKSYLGYEPQFRLQDALNDLADWMRRYLA